VSLYGVDIPSIAGNILPPDKRNTNMLAFVKALVSPIQYVVNLFLGSYRSGSPAPIWTSGAYPLGVRVRYNFAVYEAIVDGTTDVPTVATSWRLVQSNFIGVSERVLYNGQKVILEYALNKWFGTNFVQPNGTSDIYVTTNTVAAYPFLVGATEDLSSSTYYANSTEYIIDSYSFTGNYRLTIHMPSAVYTALSTVSAMRDPIVRAFADKYIPAGISYNIVTY
jgi:hypothetical protein